jgi:hypothetical protein
LLRGLGVAGEQVPAEVDGRSSLLRSLLAERRVLVILDNARDSDQVRPLLPGSGGSTTVITSRSQLRGLVAREGAHRIGLDQLEPGESEARWRPPSRHTASGTIRRRSPSWPSAAGTCHSRCRSPPSGRAGSRRPACSS